MVSSCSRARRTRTLLLAVGLLVSQTGADWRQFRGDNATSCAHDARLPTTWSEDENVAWRVPLPGHGVSSPIVVDGRVVVTCSSGFLQDHLHVLCFDGRDGQMLWEREFWSTGRTAHHPTSAVAAPSPASDGDQIYAFFSCNDLICLDLDGNLRWLRGLTNDYPRAANDVGMASSPVVVGKTVVVQVETQGDSFATGLDTATGETRWRRDRVAQNNWTSPVAGPAGDYVLLQDQTAISAHDALTGKMLWAHAAPCSHIASVVVTSDTIFVPAGGITALAHSGGSTTPEVIWEENRLASNSASPVLCGDDLFVINSAGVLVCADVKTGAIRWRVRTKGPYWATPVVAGGYLYAINSDGRAHVVRLGEEGKVVAENEFGESVFGSPAIADNALFVRTERHLWKIAQP